MSALRLLSHHLLLCVLGVCLIGFPYLVQADGPSEDQSEGQGEIEVFVFDKGSALSGITIQSSNDTSCTSDATGLCKLTMPHGRYWIRNLQNNDLFVVDQEANGFPEIPVSSRGVVTVYLEWAPLKAMEKPATEKDEDPAPPIIRYRVDAPLGPQQTKGPGGPQQDQSTTGQPAELRVTVKSMSSNRPIEMVQIFLKGLDVQEKTNSNGQATFKIPAGLYDLAFVHPDYTSLTLRDIKVDPTDSPQGDGTKSEPSKENSHTQIEATLTPSSLSLEELVISAPHVRGSQAAFDEIRRESLEVNDVIGSEQMSKNGDSSAASALKRVTGLTLLDGKYIYVRGLGERYSSVTLNGSYLPSPEPMKRVVPLDIFPSSILEGVVVQKTFTPDMPGEFGGGTLRLRTKRSLEGDRVKLSYGQSYSLEDATRLQGPQGKRDWTGFDDGTRALPKAIRKADRGKIGDGGEAYSSAELEGFGESLRNSYSVSQEAAGPWNSERPERSRALIGDNRSLSAEMRASGEMGVFQWGAQSSALYATGYEDGTRDLKRYNADSGRLTSINDDLKTTYSKRKIDAGSLGHLRLGLTDDHTIEAISLLTRKTTDTAQLKEGTTGSGDDTIRSTSIEWNERELFFNQFIGSHEFFGRLLFDWRYSQADARNYIPDSRFYRYELRGEEYLLSNRSDGNSRTFSNMVDLAEDWGVDVSLSLADWKPVVLRTKGGVASFYKRREFAARRFFFRPPDFLEASVRSSKPEDIFSAENISTSGFTLIESTRNTDTYRGRQIIDAAYGQAEVSIGESIALVSGFRLEESRQEVLTYSLHDAGLTPSRAALNDTSLLPASNLTLRLGPYVQLRGAYSKTVSRPDLRELSTGSYYDDRLNIEIEGFADLKKSDVQNIDARIELYSGDVHRFSLGVFRKDILRPIERVLLNVAGSDTKISYRNSKFARNEGIEFELATGVGPFVFSCNLALIRSAVTLDLDGIGNQTSLTSSKRPMQGVSPYILNLGLQYEPEGAPYRANLVFNEIGARITELGTNGVPDVFEQKKRTLDLVASFDVNESVSMGLKVSDIVPQGSTTTQDGKVILREPGSTTFSWTASATF